MSRLERWERRTAPVLTLLASAALVTLVTEAALDASTEVGTMVAYTAWAVFAADYATRIRLAEHRWHFVRTHPLDLLAVLLPVLRGMRLVASVARVSALAPRGLTENVIATTVLIAMTVVVTGASLGLDAERDASNASITTFGDAVWWALTTVTTVGYGDTYPVTPEGRVIGAVLMVVGIASMGAVTAAIATRLIGLDHSSAEPPPQPPQQATPADQRIRELEAEVARLSAQLAATTPSAASNGGT